MRLDKYLFENGFFSSREKAQDAISQQTVKVNGTVVDKASKNIEEPVVIEIIDIFNRYVSRGGLKLEKAIREFQLDFSEKRVLDIGASTGGFIDCALQHGAAFCCGVDIGTAQLSPKIKDNPKVLSIENKDFRALTLAETGNIPFDIITADVSFISLTYLLPYFQAFSHPDTQLVLLIKPQFEAGSSFLNKSGIVKDEKAYRIAIQKVINENLNHQYHLQKIAISTLFELQKNVEFLSLFNMNNLHYTPDYLALYAEIKRIKKELKK